MHARTVVATGGAVRPLLGALLLLLAAAPLRAQVGVVIHGRVVDAYSRQPVEGANVRVAGAIAPVFTDASGAFAVLIPTGEPLAIEVEQFGYLSQRFDLSPDAAARVSVLLLEPSPFELEEINVVQESAITDLLRDLRGRRNAYGGSVAAYDRARLERFRVRGSVWDFVRTRSPTMFECSEGLSGLCIPSRDVSFAGGPVGVPVLVCVDAWESWGAVSELGILDIQDVALVELYNRGGTVRIYTPQYLAQSARVGRNVVHPYGC